MIKYVIKNNGTIEPFTAEKLNKWAAYATKYDGSWAAISTAVYRLLPETVSSKDIHSTMTRVCSDIGDLTHSRIAARLEIARLRKNMERYVGVSDRQSFKEIMDAYTDKGFWKKDCLPEYNPVWEEWYEECKSIKKEYWELLQWSDKYSLQVDKSPIETPHVALLASALVLHGDSVWAKEMYLRSVRGKLSLPTPALNGIRNGDFDSISCSLMESGDTTDSILVANHLAARMTAKKAGIGIFHHTRSALDPVRSGDIDHLGKHGIFKHVQAAVKIFTQLSRGGSATSTVLAIDPEIESIITWKSQRSAIDIRIDQIDYTFSFNDAFLDAVVSNGDWHLFSLYHAPEVHSAFYGTTDEFNAAVQAALVLGKPHKIIKARELLKLFLTIRIETGRFYSFNASRVNNHTPYNERIHQSNLCVHGDTKLLTMNGHIAMEHNENKWVKAWNGESWSDVQILKTGVDQSLTLVRLVDDNGKEVSISATPYHKWYNTNGEEFRTSELRRGMMMEKFRNPFNMNEWIGHTIVDVEVDYDLGDTYCVNEPDRHKVVFNGVLTGQCLEIVQPTAPFRDMVDLVIGNENGDSEGEISFCGLSAANYSQIDLNDPEDVRLTVETGIRTVTRMIELAPTLHPPLRKKMLERMNVGFGITGLADAVYKSGLDYDGSDEFYAFVRDLAETHAFYAYQTSQKMFEEGGRHVPKGINLDWLPIDTAVNAINRPFKHDWESLRGKPRAHSVLVSIQPCESSSVFSGGVNAVYPARQYRIGKQSRAGIVQQIFINFDESKHTPAWKVNSGVMSMMYSCVQDCIDQAISADEFFDPRQYEGGKRPLSEYMKDFIRHYRLGNKTQYYINTRINDSESQLNTSATDCDGCKM